MQYSIVWSRVVEREGELSFRVWNLFLWSVPFRHEKFSLEDSNIRFWDIVEYTSKNAAHELSTTSRKVLLSWAYCGHWYPGTFHPWRLPRVCTSSNQNAFGNSVSIILFHVLSFCSGSHWPGIDLYSHLNGPRTVSIGLSSVAGIKESIQAKDFKVQCFSEYILNFQKALRDLLTGSSRNGISTFFLPSLYHIVELFAMYKKMVPASSKMCYFYQLLLTEQPLVHPFHFLKFFFSKSFRTVQTSRSSTQLVPQSTKERPLKLGFSCWPYSSPKQTWRAAEALDSLQPHEICFKNCNSKEDFTWLLHQQLHCLANVVVHRLSCTVERKRDPIIDD